MRAERASATTPDEFGTGKEMRKKKKAPPPSFATKKVKLQSPRDEDEDEDDAPAPAAPRLTGFAYERCVNEETGEKKSQLLLRDENTCVVYDSEQFDAKGKPMRVGKWRPSTRSVVFDSVEAAPAPEPVPGTAAPAAAPPKPAVAVNNTPRVIPSKYAFNPNQDDHAETSFMAYKDITPLLIAVARVAETVPEELAVYDPFFCTGRVAELLGQLGFPKVYNKNEDFYTRYEVAQQVPHDVLVTNPPYSAEHVSKLLTYCLSTKRPSFLLIPTYFLGKADFPGFASAARPVFVAPSNGSRYTYHAPHGLEKGRRVGRTAPFETIWVINLPGDVREKILSTASGIDPQLKVFRSLAKVPLRLLDRSDTRKQQILNSGKKSNKLYSKAAAGKPKVYDN